MEVRILRFGELEDEAVEALKKYGLCAIFRTGCKRFIETRDEIRAMVGTVFEVSGSRQDTIYLRIIAVQQADSYDCLICIRVEKP
jgi:hypothetical protein